MSDRRNKVLKMIDKVAETEASPMAFDDIAAGTIFKQLDRRQQSLAIAAGRPSKLSLDDFGQDVGAYCKALQAECDADGF